MKKMMLAAAVLALAVPAMATKARRNALGGSYHLTDNRSGIYNPALMGADHVVFEMGGTRATTGLTTVPTAEGGFVKSTGTGKWSAYLGNSAWLNDGTNTSVTLSNRSAAAGNSINANPVDFGYAAKAGDMEWGVGLSYSNSDKKTTTGAPAFATKQSMTVLKAGVVTGPWDAYVNLLLADTVDTATDKYKGSMGADLYAGYTMENNYFYGEYIMSGGKLEPAAGGAATQDNDNNSISLGYVNSMKSEGVEMFYGVAYNMLTLKEKVGDSKTETTSLPFTVGLEAEANSWMTLRGSVKQNVLLGSTKTSTAGTGDADTIPNNTTVAAGVGFKWGKASLDATLNAGVNGQIDTSAGNFLTNAAFQYTF